jgi:hypothetical protein
MKLKEIIKEKLMKIGFDRNEALVETIENLIVPVLEEKAGKLITARLIKRAVAAMLAPAEQNDPETGDQHGKA